jgi:hypothetical protein
VVRCGSKNRHHKDIMCSKEIGLHAQNALTILDSTVTMIRETYMTICEHKNRHFHNEEEIHMSSKNYEADGFGHDLNSLIVLH